METIEKAIKTFVDAAVKHGECTNKGDYRTANKQYKIIVKSLHQLKVHEEGVIQFKELMEHQSDYVRLWSSTHLLRVEEERAKRNLMSLAKKSGVISLTAQTTLDEWNKGNLKPEI